MPSPIFPNPLPATPGIAASTVAVAAAVQQRRIGQASAAAGGSNGAARIVTGTGFIASTDTWIGADTSGSACTQYLPLQAQYTRGIYEVEQYVAGNTFTVACQGSDTIDGSASITVTTRVTIRAVAPGLYHVS